MLCIPFKMRKELTFSLSGKCYSLFPASVSPMSPKLRLCNIVIVMSKDYFQVPDIKLYPIQQQQFHLGTQLTKLCLEN